MHRRLGGAAASALVMAAGTTLVFSACAPTPTPPPVTIIATVTATPEPAPEPTPMPTPVAEAPAEPAPAPAPAPVPNEPAPVIEPGPAVDLGARDGANGTPVVDGTGMPTSYTVVSGDSFFDIAQRFDLPQQQLLRMNPQVHDFGEAVYIGDVINLDWTKTG